MIFKNMVPRLETLSQGKLSLPQEFAQRVSAIGKAVKGNDQTKLRQAPVQEIRKGKQLLVQDNLGEETVHRLAAYTSHYYENGWYTLDYKNLGIDPGGNSHEISIGLGDILLDPRITEIEIRTVGKTFRARKGVVPHGKRYAGRLGFLDKNNNYVATFSGDQFRIVSEAHPGAHPDIHEQGKSPETVVVTHAVSRIEAFRDNEIQIPGHIHLEQYRTLRQKVEQFLNPSELSRIPEPREVSGALPEKPSGGKRLLVFGDTNTSYGRSGQRYLEELQRQMSEWNVDFVLGVGDYVSAGHDGHMSEEKYRTLIDHAKKEFLEFGQTPLALTVGNHDLNPAGPSDAFEKIYVDHLKQKFDYREGQQCYSFCLGEATFVILNRGDAFITQDQIDFFEARAKEGSGALYLVNHVPPFQHAYGPGLPNASETPQQVKHFDRLQALAKKNVENRGFPFYVISGHDHFATVIGNFLNPGGLGSAYYGAESRKLPSVPSVAVIDMDEQGKILSVYFRSARSGFRDGLPKLQYALATGKIISRV